MVNVNLKKGDQVKILSGKERGKTGKVLTVFPAESRIVVDGLNMFKKRVRPTKQGEKGQTVMVPRPMHVSNAILICPNCKEKTRIGHRTEGGKKVRVCKKCEAIV